MDIYFSNGGSSWNEFISDCADTTRGQYCCFTLWTLDSSIPAVNSIWELFHRFALFPEYRWISFIEPSWGNGTKRVPKVQKRSPHLLLAPCGPLSVLFIWLLRSTKGSISLCSLSPSEGMQYTVGPQFIWHESLDIFVYVLYNITVNDWNIQNYFYFVTFHIYT